MKQLKRLMASLAFLFISTVEAVPTIEHWKTSTGARVYFVQAQSLPMLDVKLLFAAGSAHDADKSGLAAITSAMLKQGAAGLTAQQIAQSIESVGAQLGVSTSRDYTAVSFRSLTEPKILDQAWGVFNKVISQPDFPQKDFERLKKQTLLSIKARGESPGTLAQLAIYEKMFANHPYASPIQGKKNSVEQLAVADLRGFYQQHFVTENLIVVLVGDLTTEAAKTRVESLLAGVKQGEQAAETAMVKELSEGVNLHQEYPSEQTHLLYGSPVLALNDPDYFALYVGNHILGGSGFTSRVVKEIREERGLAYSAYSYFRAMAAKGPFLMGLQTRNEKAAEAAGALKSTLATFIKDGPTEEELIASKKNIMGGFALRLDSNKKLLSNIANMAASGVSLDYLNTFSGKVQQVSREDIHQAFQRRIIQNNMVMVTVGQKITAQAE